MSRRLITKSSLLKFLKRFVTLAALTSLAAGVGAGINLYFTNRQVNLAEQAQAADRLEKAQAKLKSTDIEDKLVGIKEVRRTAQLYPEWARTDAIDRLTVFLQLNAKVLDGSSCGTPDTIRIVKSALGVIGELNGDSGGQIDLSGTCLSNVYISGANLSNVNFENANLRNARFFDTNLTGARFDLADLTNTQFTNVDLTDAVFCYAEVSAVDFRSGKFDRTAIDDWANASIRQRPIDMSHTEPCP